MAAKLKAFFSTSWGYVLLALGLVFFFFRARDEKAENDLSAAKAVDSGLAAQQGDLAAQVAATEAAAKVAETTPVTDPNQLAKDTSNI